MTINYRPKLGGVVRAIACLCLLTLSIAAHADTTIGAPHGDLENYFTAYDWGATTSIYRSFSYLTATSDIGNSASLTLTGLNYDKSTYLDEDYFLITNRNQTFRFGRIRTDFGFSDWSELYYQGFIELPLVRTFTLGSDGVGLNRVDTGAEWQLNSGPNQLTISAIDACSGSWQLLPNSINHVSLRYQRYIGDFILGGNALVDTQGNNNLYAGDIRWTAPHVQVRGEYDWSGYDAGRSHGFYVDMLFHPPGLLRTTFIGRVEQVQFDPGAAESYSVQSSAIPSDDQQSGLLYGQQYTLGVKQIINRNYTLEFSRFFPSGSATGWDPDWALQLITFTRF